MKHYLPFILLCWVLLFTRTLCFAQIDSALGMVTVDSCFDEKNCWNVQLDTSGNNIWQIGNTTKPFFGNLIHPPYGLMTDTINSYSANTHSQFYLRVPFFGNAVLGFWHKYQMDSLTEVGYIEYSTDTGNTWYNIYDPSGFPWLTEFNTENMYADTDTTALGIAGFTGTHSDWEFTRVQWVICVPVAPRFDCADTLLLRFTFISDSVNTNKDGWIIDGIQTFFVQMGGGVQEINGRKNALMISPNPASDKIEIAQFSANNHLLRQVEIYDAFGKKQMSVVCRMQQQATIDVHRLPDGIYFLKAEDNAESWLSGTFLKQ